MAGGKLWWQVGVDLKSVNDFVNDAKAAGKAAATGMNQAANAAGLTAGQLRALRGEWVNQRTETEKVKRAYNETTNALKVQAQQARTNIALLKEKTASSRSLIPVTSQLNQALGAVGITLGAAGLITGSKNYLNFLRESALESVRAGASLKIYWRELEDSNQSTYNGEQVLKSLAKQFITLPDVVAQGSTPFLRVGADINMVRDILEATGASALAFGRTSKDGMELAGQSFAGQNSQMLNYIGIAGNIGTENKRLADSIGKTTEQLDDAERFQAFL